MLAGEEKFSHMGGQKVFFALSLFIPKNLLRPYIRATDF